MSDTRAVRGRLVTFTGDPAADPGAMTVIDDGAVVMADGKISAVGPADEVLHLGMPVDHHPDEIIMAGLIDLHIHYPQTQVIASYGAQLLDWLNTYTFPEEQKFSDAGHAAGVAEFFLDELMRNGTTTAAVYCTSAVASVEAFFAASAARNTRMIAGKVLMDRHAPPGLLDTAAGGVADSRALLEAWHGNGRQLYGITPRFAITSTDEQLELAGQLAADFPDVYVQTHLAENHDEIAEVARLFPDCAHYTDVYDRFGLLGPRSLLGHCIHLSADERTMLRERQAVAVFCPTSNMFIGSGLFDLAALRADEVRTGLATDIGGGTSYSMLATAGAAYQVLQLNGQNWPAAEAFYAMTLGNARALRLDGTIGSLTVGHEADVVVLNPRATPAMAHRMETAGEDIDQALFVLMTLGDDRAVSQTYVAGRAMLQG